MDPTLTSKSDTTEENLGQFGTAICIAFGTARFLYVLYGVSVSLHASLQPSLHYLLFVGGTLPREHCMVGACGHWSTNKCRHPERIFQASQKPLRAQTTSFSVVAVVASQKFTDESDGTVSTSEINNDGEKYTAGSLGWRTGHVRKCIRTGTTCADQTSGQNSNNISANVGRQRRRD